MQTLLYFSKAFLASLAIQIPIGPISMLCIKKTLEMGFRGAVLVGIGATLADGVYATIAALGLSAVSDVIYNNKTTIKLLGGLFLLYLAYKETKSVGIKHYDNNRINKEINEKIDIKNKTNIKTIIEIFIITAINPVTILSFMGIFASLDLEPRSSMEGVVLVAGICLGSIIWWLTLGAIIVRVKNKLPQVFLDRVKWISCFILGIFGVLIIFDAIWK